MDAELEGYLMEVLLRAEKALDDLGACEDSPEACLVGADDDTCVSALWYVRDARGALELRRRERIEREFVEDAEPYPPGIPTSEDKTQELDRLLEETAPYFEGLGSHIPESDELYAEAREHFGVSAGMVTNRLQWLHDYKPYRRGSVSMNWLAARVLEALYVAKFQVPGYSEYVEGRFGEYMLAPGEDE